MKLNKQMISISLILLLILGISGCLNSDEKAVSEELEKGITNNSQGLDENFNSEDSEQQTQKNFSPIDEVEDNSTKIPESQASTSQSISSKSSSSSSSNSADAYYPVTISNYNYDKEEYEVTFTEMPRRVITTNQPPTELMLILGLEDYMVGTAWMDNEILPELEDKYNTIPVLSDRYPSKEIVIAQEPDLIIGWKSVFDEKNIGSVESWNNDGVNTFIQRNSGVAPDKTLENMYKDIEDIGVIFNVEDRAEELITSMQTRISVIEEMVKDEDPVTVLVIEGEGNEYRFYGPDSLANDMVEKAGGINLANESGSFSAELIAAKNPDVIILIHYLEQDAENQKIEALKSNPGLASVNAIQNGRIIYTPLSETYAGGVRVVDGIERFAKGFYPELLI